MDVAIIGSGIIGLLSALTLTDAGYRVTIIARDLPGDDNQDWASPWAGAAIFPHPDAPGHDLQTETFKYYWDLAHRDPTSGVQVVKATEFYDDRSDDSTIWYKTLVPDYRPIPAPQLPQGATIGFTYQTTAANPALLLPWLKRTLEARNVRFIQRELHRLDDARHLTGCKVVVHASGLGASLLANDQDVIGVRGQTMFVETAFSEMKMLQGSRYVYVIPRMGSGGAIVGGVSQEGNLDGGVDASLRPVMLERVKGITGGGLDAVDLGLHAKKDIVAFRPARKRGFRLEREREREGDVVHAYGFGSLGYVFSYGVAGRVCELVRLVVREQGSRL